MSYLRHQSLKNYKLKIRIELSSFGLTVTATAMLFTIICRLLIDRNIIGVTDQCITFDDSFLPMEIKKWLPKFQTCQEDEEYPTSIINKVLDVIHGGPKFGPLPPLSRDSICMPSQIWSTDVFFEIFDHMINSRRLRKL